MCVLYTFLYSFQSLRKMKPRPELEPASLAFRASPNYAKPFSTQYTFSNNKIKLEFALK